MITVYGSNANADQLRAIPLETPDNAGRYWQGIQHGRLVDVLSMQIRNRGWEITESRFSLSKDQADLAGAFKMRLPGVDTPEGMDLSLGFVTSNALRKSLKMVVGAVVQVCNNGMATGEIVMQKKHTKQFSLSDEIQKSLDVYEVKSQTIKETVTRLRERELSPTEADEILMEAGRNHLMPFSRIGLVDAEYRKPTFEEHGRGTSWALLNAFTYIVKKNPVHAQMNQMNKFRELLPTANVSESDYYLAN
jgi:hypothetical protein